LGGWHVHLHILFTYFIQFLAEIEHCENSFKFHIWVCFGVSNNVLVDFASVLTLCPWAEHGSCSAQGLLIFLPMQTWMEHGSCSALGLFFIYFVLLVFRPKLPLGQIVSRTLNPAACGVYLPKAVKTLMY